mmetsp:Transcript_129058/g.359326  ORF Transcript_129058/g.359326 Transcript_129058/m.359326 type:complete len:103 (-) Transcript_129058:391-699(-)
MATCSDKRISKICSLMAWLQRKPTPMPLCLFPWEGALVAEVLMSEHGCRAGNAVLKHKQCTDSKRVERTTPTRWLHRISPLEENLPLLALNAAQRLAPPFGM